MGRKQGRRSLVLAGRGQETDRHRAGAGSGRRRRSRRQAAGRTRGQATPLTRSADGHGRPERFAARRKKPREDTQLKDGPASRSRPGVAHRAPSNCSRPRSPARSPRAGPAQDRDDPSRVAAIEVPPLRPWYHPEPRTGRCCRGPGTRGRRPSSAAPDLVADLTTDADAVEMQAGGSRARHSTVAGGHHGRDAEPTQLSMAGCASRRRSSCRTSLHPRSRSRPRWHGRPRLEAC